MPVADSQKLRDVGGPGGPRRNGRDRDVGLNEAEECRSHPISFSLSPIRSITGVFAIKSPELPVTSDQLSRADRRWSE